MTEATYDILGIGNAIVDVVTATDDQFLSRHDMHKGAMALVDTDAADAIYAAMPPGQESSGGSAANTCAVAAALGAQGRLYRQGRRRPAWRSVPPRHQRRRRPLPHRAAGRRRAHRPLPDPGHARRPAHDEHLPRRLRVTGRRGRAIRIWSAWPRSPTWRATCSTRLPPRPPSTRPPRPRTPLAARSRCPSPTPSASTATAMPSANSSPATSTSCSPTKLRSPASTNKTRSRPRPRWRGPRWPWPR